MTFGKAQYIAVVGAGIAGAACADALGRAGHAVHVFDKSRGPGGRLAARRLEWIDRHGQACTTRLDHGAVALTARSEAFRALSARGLSAALLQHAAQASLASTECALH